MRAVRKIRVAVLSLATGIDFCDQAISTQEAIAAKVGCVGSRPRQHCVATFSNTTQDDRSGRHDVADLSDPLRRRRPSKPSGLTAETV